MDSDFRFLKPLKTGRFLRWNLQGFFEQSFYTCQLEMIW
jgi:hypothetical protein